MNIILDTVEKEILKELMRRGVVTGKRYTDEKAYVKEVLRRLYLNLWHRETIKY